MSPNTILKTNHPLLQAIACAGVASAMFMTTSADAGEIERLPEVLSYTNQDVVTRLPRDPDTGSMHPLGPPRWRSAPVDLDPLTPILILEGDQMPSGLTDTGEFGGDVGIGDLWYLIDAPSSGDVTAGELIGTGSATARSAAALAEALSGSIDVRSGAGGTSFGSPIPAPGVLGLLVIGGAAALGRSRRRRH